MPATATAQSTLDELRAAVDERRYDALESCYAEDAVILHYSERNRPGSAERMTRSQLVDLFKDAPSKGRVDEVIDAVAGDDRFAYTMRCTYSSGEIVMATVMCDVRDGRITRQVGVEAWDE